MTAETPFYVTHDQWKKLVDSARRDRQVLRDGAEIEVLDLPGVPAGAYAIAFYATKTNTPADWPYPILDEDGSGRARAYIGDAQRDTNGRIVFQVFLKEAVEQLQADYRGGAVDLDEAAFDERAEEVAAGREEDRKWLIQEFLELLATCEIPATSTPAA